MSILFSMALFSLTMSISPGPVNVVAMTSGVKYGFGRSLTFVSGATIGFITLLFVIGVGLGGVMQDMPIIIETLKYIGCVYLSYLGIRIYLDRSELSDPSNDALSRNEKPRDQFAMFFQGALMQWVNPKAWIACLAGCSAFGVYQSIERLGQFLGIYFVLCFIGIAAWAFLGNTMKHFFQSSGRSAWFNRVIGLCLIVLALSLLVD